MQFEPENRILGGMEHPEGAAGRDLEGMRGVGNGMRGMLLVLAGIVAGDWFLLYHEPGAGVGAYFLILLGLVWLRAGPVRIPWAMVGLYAASAVQSVIFTSFSNGLVLLGLLLMLSGEWGSSGWESRRARWLEGWLSLLRPLGSFLEARQVLAEESGERPGRIRQGLRIAAPTAFLLLVFVPLLSGGNAVFGLLTEAFLRNLELPHPGDLICWALLGTLGMILIFPAKRSGLAGRLCGNWQRLGSGGESLRLMQWGSILVVLNLLFLLSNILDVSYLWFSRELPEGVTYSRYVHQGVYALITTTVLSALILGLLTQHADAIRRNAKLQALALLWVLQNLILISGVFLRLSLYVDAYGYTPKRIYVALFLGLVIGGFASLVWAITRLRDLKWLSRVNLTLVFALFTAIHFVDVPGIVARKNMALYSEGSITRPDTGFLRQIGSHAVPFMIHVRANAQTVADAEEATQWLSAEGRCSVHYGSKSSWQSFQLRDERNRRVYAAYLQGLNLSKTP